MSFMQREKYTGVYYAIETGDGTTFVPGDCLGDIPDMVVGVVYGPPDRSEDYAQWKDWTSRLADYVPSRWAILSIEKCRGESLQTVRPGLS